MAPYRRPTITSRARPSSPASSSSSSPSVSVAAASAFCVIVAAVLAFSYSRSGGAADGVTSPIPFIPKLSTRLLAVRNSTLLGAGLGTFARRPLRRKFRSEYKCELFLTTDVPDWNPGKAWKINDTHSCDAAMRTNKNPMAFVNSVSSLASCALYNVQAIIDEGKGRVFYESTRRIAAGEELLTDYGQCVWVPAVKPPLHGMSYREEYAHP